MLDIKNLKATVNDQTILNGLDIAIRPGEIHAIMGPNGSGKSTLSKLITGHPGYEVTDGTLQFNGEDLTEKEAYERALMGIFMGFQYPVEIPGVNNNEFLRMAFNAQRKYRNEPEMDPIEFETLIQKQLKSLNMDEKYLTRDLNSGFSGGEKKRNEILQMTLLNPKLVILDEIDSGLDIDALKAVADAVNRFKSKDNAFLIITHYQRLLDYIIPDVVHIIADGKILKTGDAKLALEVEEKGYDWLLKTGER